MKTIVLLGNHEVPFSSESHYAWTFENKLGWKVVRIQENRTSASEVIQQCSKADLFFWVHTHGWAIPNEHVILDHVKSAQIPSFSYHLDRYFGIPAREGAYLQHPSFHLDYFFSTDGGNDEKWKQAGINHHWVLGGCVEYGCYLAAPNGSPVEVLFAGSEGYHGEYHFRPQLIAALRANYGNRFKVVQGIREEALNALYASTTVCVGDHIFAGCPRYCSDRLFETLGRGGFIIYPETEGVTETIPGLVTYRPQDVQDLIHKIDYYLDKGNDNERTRRRNDAYDWCKENATYTHRLRQILEIMGMV